MRDGRDVTRMGVGNGEEPFRNLCWCLREVDGVPQRETWWVRIVITIYRTAVWRDGKFCLFSDLYHMYLRDCSPFISERSGSEEKKNRREKRCADSRNYGQTKFFSTFWGRYVKAETFLNIHYSVQFPEPPSRNQRRKMTALM